MRRLSFGLLLVVSVGMSQVQAAPVVLSANDGHSVLENGKQVLPVPLLPDSVSVLERGADGIWHVARSIDVHTSVVGPPTAMAFSADGAFAYVTSASTADMRPHAIVPDDTVSVIDLSHGAPQVVQTVAAVQGATTPRLTPDGLHLLVAGGKSGQLAWFRVEHGRLSARQVVALPGAPGFPAGLAILPDGKTALVSLWKGDQVFRLHIDGSQISVDPQPLALAPGPWTIRLTRDAHYAAINILGHGEGLPGEIAMVDLRAMPWRVVQRVPVPNAPEGMDISPDGTALAVVSQNGSAVLPSSPYYHARGIVTVFHLKNGHLIQAAQADGTLWPQGLIFAPDGREILVQGVMDRSLRTLRWNGHDLRVQGDAPLPAGGADLERSR